MDGDLFLQCLRDLSLEEGRAYIEEHLSELSDHTAVGQILKDESQRQRDIHPFTALKLAELLIFFGERSQHPFSLALGFSAKGDALSALGYEQAAIDCFDTAGSIFLQLDDEVNWARTRTSWIISCAWIGRVDEALQEVPRIRELFLKHEDFYWVYVTDHQTAVIYSQIGQYQKALELYERMLVLFPTLPDLSESAIKRSIAMIEYNQARNLSWLGDFERASRLFQQAKASFAEFGHTFVVISVEINLADLDYVQGYYGTALRRFYQIRDNVLLQNLDSAVLAHITLRIAHCLVKLNRAQEACQLAAEAVEVYRQLGMSLDVGNTLREYAATLVAARRLKDAVAILDEARSLFEQGGFTHHATATGLQQADLLLEMHSVTAAYDQAYLLKAHFDRQGLVARSAEVSLVMAGALVERAGTDELRQDEAQQGGLLQDASMLCEQVIVLAQQHNLQEQVYKGQYLLGRIAFIQGNLAKAEQHYRAAIEQIERILGDLVHDLRPSFLHTTWAVYEDMIALCLRQKQFETAFSYLERARSMTLRQYLNAPEKTGVQTPASTALQVKNATVLRLENELSQWQRNYHHYSAQLASFDTSVSPVVDRETIRAELLRCETKIGELFERLHLAQIDTEVHETQAKQTEEPLTKTMNVLALRQHLLPDQLLLAYFLYKDNLVIFAMTREQLVTHEYPGGVMLLERLLPPLYAHLEPRGWPDPQQPPQQAIRRLLQKLYDLLITPVSSLLPSSSGLLTIVPYGPLHNLPFHALYDGERFLIEEFQINYLPATNVLNVFTQPEQPHVQNTPKTPLIFGYSGNGDLLRAIDEAKALETMLHGKSYLEEDATIARLVEEAAGSPLIHLATHGHCRLDAPNFSYIRLADGQLNAIDAFSLDLAGCELVTLSGCETGLALSGGGDEQLGLGRAFMAAGASSLVMSLWPVEDGATNELMLAFYQHLLRGNSKVQALRSAQCSMLKRTSSMYTHPYFWAAFHLVGDIGPLQLETSERH